MRKALFSTYRYIFRSISFSFFLLLASLVFVPVDIFSSNITGESTVIPQKTSASKINNNPNSTDLKDKDELSSKSNQENKQILPNKNLVKKTPSPTDIDEDLEGNTNIEFTNVNQDKAATEPPKVDLSIGNVSKKNTSDDFSGIYGDNVKVEYRNPPNPHLEDTIGKWYVLKEIDKNGKKKCYTVSYPDSSVGNHKSQRKPYIMVVIKGRKVFVFIATGYEFAQSSKLFSSIDGMQFAFDTKDYIASFGSIESDFEFVKMMNFGSKVIIYARSSVGTYSVDIYSLQDFVSAYKKIVAMCSI